MSISSQAPKRHIAPSITNRVACPVVTRRIYVRLTLVPVLVALLGLGLAWASSALAQDLPIAPVHLEVTSSDSAEVNVDLGDPTKFPFSSTGKWKGYLEFLGKPGTERSLGQPDLLLPVLQDINDMTFLNVRGQLQFDNTDVHEYNIGVGHRHMFQEWILGGYGYFDHRNTQFNNSYNQFTGGLELMSVDWAFRVNGYLPENKTETMTSGANATVIRPGDGINVQVDGVVQEKALPGVDGEVGYLLPIPWKAYRAVFDETRVYAGGYHFIGEDGFESVTGPRGRVEWRAYDLPVLGPGSRFMMGVEAQWDEPRGSQAFGLASLRIPFDVFSDKSKRKALKGLDRRMLQPVIRDVDVVTSERDLTEILPALNPAGKAYTLAVDVTREEYNEAQDPDSDTYAKYEGEVVAFFIDGKGETVAGSDFTAPGGDHTAANGGKWTPIDYVSKWLGEGTIRYIAPGTPFTLKGGCNSDDAVVTMNPGGHLNGMIVDGTGCNSGIRVQDAGTYYITNSQASNATEYGLWASGADVDLTIRHSQFNNNIETGIKVDDGVALTASYVEASHNGDGIETCAGGIDTTGADTNGCRHGILVSGASSILTGDHLTLNGNGTAGLWATGAGTKVSVTDSEMSYNGFAGSDTGGTVGRELGTGVFAGGGPEVYLTRVRLIGNGEDGVELNNLNTFMSVKDSFFDGNVGKGIHHSGFNGELVVDSTVIQNSGDDGIFVWEGTATIKNTQITGSGDRGINIGAHFPSPDFPTNVTIEDVIVRDSTNDGVSIRGYEGRTTNVTMERVAVEGFGSNGLRIFGDNTTPDSLIVNVTGTTIDGLHAGSRGVDVSKGILNIFDSFVQNNIDDGMRVSDGATIDATRVTVTGNAGYGVGSTGSGSIAEINDSSISDNDLGDFFEELDGEIFIDGAPLP